MTILEADFSNAIKLKRRDGNFEDLLIKSIIGVFTPVITEKQILDKFGDKDGHTLMLNLVRAYDEIVKIAIAVDSYILLNNVSSIFLKTLYARHKRGLQNPQVIIINQRAYAEKYEKLINSTSNALDSVIFLDESSVTTQQEPVTPEEILAETIAITDFVFNASDFSYIVSLSSEGDIYANSNADYISAAFTILRGFTQGKNCKTSTKLIEVDATLKEDVEFVDISDKNITKEMLRELSNASVRLPAFMYRKDIVKQALGFISSNDAPEEHTPIEEAMACLNIDNEELASAFFPDVYSEVLGF